MVGSVKKGATMDKSYAQSGDKIEKYVTELFNPQDTFLLEIVRRAAREGLPPIHVSPLDGLHLEVLTRAIGAKKAVEIGTLAGYSGVRIARGLAPQGRLYTFEFSDHRARVARKSFEKAGLSKKVEILVGPAVNNLKKIESKGPFDLVFIDADKESYPHYLEWAARNLRVGGVFLGDNSFAKGKISDSKTKEANVKALQKFNHIAATNKRFKSTILPTGEGLTFGVKVK
jgi:caffeoyl-CoA O-methyltransferase